MKVMMVKDFQWLGEYRIDKFEVRHYVACHKNGVDREEGLVFIMYEGEQIINVRVPLIVEYNAQDRFLIEPSSKGLRVFLGCSGFMIFIAWLCDVHDPRGRVLIRTLIQSIFLNSKLPTSGLSAYIKDKLMEE